MLGNGVAKAVSAEYTSDFKLPNVESREGMDLLERDFGGAGGGNAATIVFEAEAGVDRPGGAGGHGPSTSASHRRAPACPSSAPTTPEGAGPDRHPGDAAGKVAFARLELARRRRRQPSSGTSVDQIEELAPDVDGVRIEFGGEAFGTFEPPSSELLGLAFAIVILILAFGSVLAMGLPIGVALAGIGDRHQPHRRCSPT